MKQYLFVPSTARGNGTGHLVRCMEWARELDSLPGCGAALFLPREADSDHWTSAEILRAFPEKIRGLRIVDSPEDPGAWDFIVLDQRNTGAEEERKWRTRAPTVALDEGGPAFGTASFCIDILPRLGGASGGRYRNKERPPSNLYQPGFLDLPKRRRERAPENPGRVLLAFGGEDPRDLGARTARALVESGLARPESLTLIRGALHEGSREFPASLRVITSVPNLKESLADFDVVITQFGLTAYEAAWAGCAVLLVNPGPYHAALARSAGFRTAGVGGPEPKALTQGLADPAALARAASRALPERRESLPARLAALKAGGPGVCPVCGAYERTAEARHPGKSHFRCAECGIVYRELFQGRDNPYGESYFFEEYKQQYGRTYLEDFPALTALAAGRLDILERLLQGEKTGQGRKVLDIGCAYGAFVSEAARRGWEAQGLDIAPTAVEYVRNRLDLPAEAGDFLDPRVRSKLRHPVDCLSLWFVLEHFDRLGEVLSAAAEMVRPGGILAFSTPSGAGISARKDRWEFYARSPEDHVTVWEPARTAGILTRWGFRVERIRVTGHHTERFPGFLGWKGMARWTGAASRFFGLGDTFECYARRVESAGRREE